MAGLQPSGFTRKTLAELVAATSANGQITFGSDLNTSDDSVFRQLYGPLSLELDQIWQELQATYAAYTKAGAEGVHLDNFYSFVGIARLDAARATETILIGSNGDTPDPTVLPPVRLSNNFGIGFVPTSNTTIGVDNTFAYRVLLTDVALNTTYTVTLSDVLGVTQTLSIVTTNEASRLTALSSLRTFLLSVRPDLMSITVLNAEGLYIGYSTPEFFSLPAQSFNLNLSPFAGIRYNRAVSQSEETGLQEGRAFDSYAINPTFTGFVHALGAGSFFPGRNVETDAEYRARAERQVQQVNTTSSTAESIISDVNRQLGVVDSFVYENPTDAATSVVGQPFAIHVLVFGGNSVDIATAIIRNIPLNIAMTGSLSVQVPNNAGTNVNVRYTAATEVDLEFRIDYDTTLDNLLSTGEEITLRNTIGTAINSMRIGQTLNVFQLQSSIVTALSQDRLNALTVNVRRVGEVAYQTTNLIPLFSDIFRLPDTSTIIFNKV